MTQPLPVSQTEFRTAVLDAAAPRPAGLENGAGAPAGRRFDVYRNNVAVSLTEALETAFPVIRKLVGDANFKLLAGAFLRAHPPTSPVMMFYGAEMPGYLATFEPTAKIGYLPDVARIELALRQAYHAADAMPLAPERLEAMAPDALMASHVTLSPALRLIRSRWPAFSVWRYNSEPGAPKPEMAAEDTLILRPEYDPLPVLLPPGGGIFIERLQAGDTLGSAYEAALAATPEVDLGAIFATLIGHGALTDIGETP